jgi:NAD(P)-dependent dehydrogenase (short-subunit alcohol dehydrogenase family)
MGVVTKVLAVSVVLIAIWFGFFARQYAAGGAVNPEWLNRSLAGRTAIVTGGNAGIGFITAKQLAKQGATVIIASRDEKRAKEAVASINNETNSNLAEFVHPLDLSSFRSVRDFVEKVKDRKIDYLINNAGVMIPPHAQTEDGFEIQFQTNHLSHFLVRLVLLANACSSPNCY